MSQSSEPQKTTLWDIIKSVAASIFGVQSDKNRQRDFQQQSIIPYIVVGIVFVLLLIFGLILLVSQIL